MTDESIDPSSPETAPFDDRGISTRTNKIVDSGRLATYLHNCTKAAKMNVKMTTNAGLVKDFGVSIHTETRSTEVLMLQVVDS